MNFFSSLYAKFLQTNLCAAKIIFPLILLLFLSVLLDSCTRNDYAPVNNAWSPTSKSVGTYKVRKGDTLYSIAFRYDIDYRALARANHLSAPYELEVGQVISLKTRPIAKPVHSVTRPKSGFTVKTTPGVYIAPRTSNQSVKSVPIYVSKNKWVWPAKGKIIAYYAPAKGEKGVDIAGRKGEPVYAAASGKVAYAGNGLRGYGNLVIIKHNDEFLSAYAHNQKILVRDGQQVQAGQKIATMGNTEANRVMLHFEIREAGRSVNPLDYVKP